MNQSLPFATNPFDNDVASNSSGGGRGSRDRGGGRGSRDRGGRGGRGFKNNSYQSSRSRSGSGSQRNDGGGGFKNKLCQSSNQQNDNGGRGGKEWKRNTILANPPPPPQHNTLQQQQRSNNINYNSSHPPPQTKPKRKLSEDHSTTMTHFTSSNPITSSSSFTSTSTALSSSSYPPTNKKAKLENSHQEFNLLDPSSPTQLKKITSRAQQISYGMNTLGYDVYLNLYPDKNVSRPFDAPRTPDSNVDIPNKRWVGMVKGWRKGLHFYDPVGSSDAVGGKKKNENAGEETSENGNEKEFAEEPLSEFENVGGGGESNAETDERDCQIILELKMQAEEDVYANLLQESDKNPFDEGNDKIGSKHNEFANEMANEKENAVEEVEVIKENGVYVEEKSKVKKVEPRRWADDTDSDDDLL